MPKAMIPFKMNSKSFIVTFIVLISLTTVMRLVFDIIMRQAWLCKKIVARMKRATVDDIAFEREFLPAEDSRHIHRADPAVEVRHRYRVEPDLERTAGALESESGPVAVRRPERALLWGFGETQNQSVPEASRGGDVQLLRLLRHRSES